MLLQSGIDAAQQGRYQEAVQLLEQFSQNCPDQSSPDYLKAQMWLVKAHQGTGEIEKAIILCQKLMMSKRSLEKVNISIGISPWMDLIQMNSEGGTIINSYHRFWSFLLGGGLIILGLVFAM